MELTHVSTIQKTVEQRSNRPGWLYNNWWYSPKDKQSYEESEKEEKPRESWKRGEPSRPDWDWLTTVLVIVLIVILIINVSHYFVWNWSTSQFCIYNLVSVNIFLCHGKKYLVLFTKTVIMISRKDYQNQNDFHPGIYLQSKNFSFTTKWPFTHWKFIDASEFQTWPDRQR